MMLIICIVNNGPALVQMMGCHHLGAKPLSKPMLAYYQSDTGEQIAVGLKPKYNHFFFQFSFREYAFEIVVCQMMAILSQPQCVNTDPFTDKVNAVWM